MKVPESYTGPKLDKSSDITAEWYFNIVFLKYITFFYRVVELMEY